MRSTYTEILVSVLRLNKETIWIPSTHKLDARGFHLVALRLAELEEKGKVRILERNPESKTGCKLWGMVRFKRIK